MQNIGTMIANGHFGDDILEDFRLFVNSHLISTKIWNTISNLDKEVQEPLLLTTTIVANAHVQEILRILKMDATMKASRTETEIEDTTENTAVALAEYDKIGESSIGQFILNSISPGNKEVIKNMENTLKKNATRPSKKDLDNRQAPLVPSKPGKSDTQVSPKKTKNLKKRQRETSSHPSHTVTPKTKRTKTQSPGGRHNNVKGVRRKQKRKEIRRLES